MNLKCYSNSTQVQKNAFFSEMTKKKLFFKVFQSFEPKIFIKANLAIKKNPSLNSVMWKLPDKNTQKVTEKYIYQHI